MLPHRRYLNNFQWKTLGQIPKLFVIAFVLFILFSFMGSSSQEAAFGAFVFTLPIAPFVILYFMKW